jgi:hypothetical protein
MACSWVFSRLLTFSALFNAQNWTGLQSLYNSNSVIVVHDLLDASPNQDYVWRGAHGDGARGINRTSTLLHEDVNSKKCLEIGRMTILPDNKNKNKNNKQDSRDEVIYLSEWEPQDKTNTLDLFGWFESNIFNKLAKPKRLVPAPDPRWTSWLDSLAMHFNQKQFELIPLLFPSGNSTSVVVPVVPNMVPDFIGTPRVLPDVLRNWYLSGLRMNFTVLEALTFGGFGHIVVETPWRIVPRCRIYIRWTLPKAEPQLFVIFG